jgi:hypothetical protein
MKPLPFSGTQCFILRDYVVCAARVIGDKSGKSEKPNEKEARNYLFVWKKPTEHVVGAALKMDIYTSRIIRMNDPPFSTKNSLLSTPLYSGNKNTILYMDQDGYVIEMMINLSDISFRIKDSTEKHFKLVLSPFDFI